MKKAALLERIEALERRVADLEARAAYTPVTIQPDPNESTYWTSRIGPATVSQDEHDRLLAQSLTVHSGVWKAMA